MTVPPGFGSRCQSRLRVTLASRAVWDEQLPARDNSSTHLVDRTSLAVDEGGLPFFVDRNRSKACQCCAGSKWMLASHYVLTSHQCLTMRPERTHTRYAEFILVADMNVPHGDLQVVDDLGHEGRQQTL